MYFLTKSGIFLFALVALFLIYSNPMFLAQWLSGTPLQRITLEASLVAFAIFSVVLVLLLFYDSPHQPAPPVDAYIGRVNSFRKERYEFQQDLDHLRQTNRHLDQENYRQREELQEKCREIEMLRDLRNREPSIPRTEGTA